MILEKKVGDIMDLYQTTILQLKAKLEEYLKEKEILLKEGNKITEENNQYKNEELVKLDLLSSLEFDEAFLKVFSNRAFFKIFLETTFTAIAIATVLFGGAYFIFGDLPIVEGSLFYSSCWVTVVGGNIVVYIVESLPYYGKKKRIEEVHTLEEIKGEKENLKQEIKQVQKQISMSDQRVKQTNEKIARLEGVIQSIENVLDTLLKEREKAVNLLIYDNLSVEESLNESFQNSESVLKLVREIEKEEK